MKKTFLLVLLLSLSFALGQTVAQWNLSASTSNFNSGKVTSWVTVADYCSFLNAVAAEDPHSLYNKLMEGEFCDLHTTDSALIARFGTPGNYSYLVVAGNEEQSICWVTWFSAARFCNWKENGSPDRHHVTPETTEEGSYTLDGAMSGIIQQNQGVTYMLPSFAENISDALQSSLLYAWGSLNDPATAVPIFSNSEEGAESCDPTLASNNIGFCLLSFEEDSINYASLAAASQQTESGSIWRDVEIGTGIAIVAAIVSSFVYHRCLYPPREGVQGGGASATELAAERRDADEHQLLEDHENGVLSSDASTSGRADALKVGAESSATVMVHQESNTIAALQAELVTLKAELEEKTKEVLLHRDSTGQAMLDKEKLQKQIEEQQQAIVFHEQRIVAANSKLAQHEEALLQHQEALTEYTDPQERAARLTSFQEENKKVQPIEALLSRCAVLEELCLKGKGGTETLSENIEKTSVYSTSSSASKNSIGSNSSAAGEAVNEGTAFQNFRALVQDATIKQQHYLERNTKNYFHKEEAGGANAQIQIQLEEAVEANNKLAEYLGVLRTAKKNLWKHRGQIMDDFADHQAIPQQITKISENFNRIENAAPIFANKIATCFAATHSLYDQNELFNNQHLQQDEAKVRTLAAAPITAGGIPTKRPSKTKTSLSQVVSSLFHHSSPDNINEKFNKESEQATACNGITTIIQTAFSTVLIPVTDKVESCMTQSYALLHLAEKNAMEGMRLMHLYEADKGKVAWGTSPLRHYLVSTLRQARELLSTVQDFFGEVKGEVYQFAAFINEEEIKAQTTKIATRVTAERIEEKLQQASAHYTNAESIQQSLVELYKKACDAGLFEEAKTHNSSARQAFYEAIRSINAQAQAIISPPIQK